MNLEAMGIAARHINDVGCALYEYIARGEPCPACDAPWNDHHLDHEEGCLYLELASLAGDYDEAVALAEEDEMVGFALISALTGVPTTECPFGHGYVGVTDAGGGPGFAGPIYHYTMTCGCMVVDASQDNAEAAR